MNKKLIIIGLISLTVPLSAQAESDKMFALGLNAGSKGIGFDIVSKLSDKFNLRGSYSQYDISDSFDEEGIDYDGEFELKTTGITLDYHPFNSGFRISAGYFNNGTKLLAAAQASGGTVNINDYEYDISGESVDVVMDWDASSPYLGVGWGNSLGEGSNLTFTIDIGVLLTGEPTASLSATQGLHESAALDGRNLSADLAAEESELNEDLSDFNKYPVIQLGMTYAF